MVIVTTSRSTLEFNVDGNRSDRLLDIAQQTLTGYSVVSKNNKGITLYSKKDEGVYIDIYLPKNRIDPRVKGGAF